MGRYFDGDISGKFWFAVQSSNDADFFGVDGTRPEELNYYFEEEDLEGVNEGIKKCLDAMGDYYAGLKDFFDNSEYYSDEMVSKALDISEEKAKELQVWYARLELGIKIKQSLENTGQCDFTAEM